jgi:DNA-binding MarR family transcriptional regulator
MSPRPRPLRQSPPAGQVAQELSRVFFELLMRHKAQFAEEVAELGLSPIQARVILCIDPEAPCTMSQVAQELGCGPSNITGLIDKLEARGLVERRARADDRRIKSLAMTRRGGALRRRLTEQLAQPSPWMRALSPEDQQQLVQILRRALELAAVASADEEADAEA